MRLLDFLQNLSLPAMFAAALAFGLAAAWVTLGLVRLALAASRRNPAEPLPVRDSIIGAISAMFALMVAFSAAGIWSDALQARTAVQREANALEAAQAMAAGLPAEAAALVRDAVRGYAREVLASVWPAMAHAADIDNPVFEKADALLVAAIDALARTQASPGGPPILPPLLAQLTEARSARLARLTAAAAGVTAAQWSAMLLLALCALAAVAMCNSHHRAMQLVATHLYAVAAAAAFFVVLAHDRPFTGPISVSPAPIAHLAGR